ncbi:hypothetical protein NDAWWUGD_CDS0153 [Salmonella phage SeKF_80]
MSKPVLSGLSWCNRTPPASPYETINLTSPIGVDGTSLPEITGLTNAITSSFRDNLL